MYRAVAWLALREGVDLRDGAVLHRLARQAVAVRCRERRGDAAQRREVVAAFLAASQRGDFTALLAILDPGVVLRADATAVEASVARAGPNVPALAPEIRGRDTVANIFRGRAKAARFALVDGDAGLVFAPGGQPRVVVDFVVEAGRIAEINFIADAERLASLSLAF